MCVVQKYSLVLLAIMAFTIHGHADITILNQYNFGDADPGAMAGNSANSQTIDSVGSENLLLNGTATYSSNVPASILAGSPDHLSLSLNGNGYFTYGTELTDAQDNFGLEIYVNAASLIGSSGIIYNGKPGSTGFGIVQVGNQVQAEIGQPAGGVFFGGTTITTGSWFDLAIVRDNGVSTFYVDGVAEGTSAVTPRNDSPPFNVGSRIGPLGEFNGLVDNARLFTFASGGFSSSNLQTAAVPEPSTVWLIISGIPGLLALRKRYAALRPGYARLSARSS